MLSVSLRQGSSTTIAHMPGKFITVVTVGTDRSKTKTIDEGWNIGKLALSSPQQTNVVSELLQMLPLSAYLHFTPHSLQDT